MKYNIFDCSKLIERQDIFSANEFVWDYLRVPFFEFNGKVWKVMNPKQFNMSEASTEIVFDDESV